MINLHEVYTQTAIGSNERKIAFMQKSNFYLDKQLQK